MKLLVGENEIDIDHNILKFSENNLNDFLFKYSSFYAYYHEKSVEADYIYNTMEDEYDLICAKIFKEAKENGCTDKTSDAAAKLHPDAIAAKAKLREFERTKDHFVAFKKSLEKAHLSAVNICWNLRGEMKAFNHQTIKELGDIIN